MNERMFTLGERLAACADLVRPGSVVADIGTDHAKLPVWLVDAGISPRAVASDINAGPIESARRNIARYGLGDKIDTRIGGGLSTVTPGEVQDIVVAGMGGELIAVILDDAPWVCSEQYRLILQPMSHPERLRRWLFEHGFSLMDERAVADAGKIYTVMCAVYTGEQTPCDDARVYAGGLLGKTDQLSRRFLQRQASQLVTAASGLRLSGGEQEAERLEQIAEELTGGQE